jgi:hypothetical protein
VGELVEQLDGLRCLCPMPNSREARFDLVGLDPDQGLVFLPNVGTRHAPDFPRREPLGTGPDLGLGEGRVVQIVSVDWDQDGLPDLLVGFDGLEGYWPDSPRVPPAQQKGFNQKGGHPSYNRDGLWRGGTPVGRVVWLRNAGNDGAPSFELQPDLVGESHPLDIGLHPAPVGVSWERRGSLELLLTDRRGLVQLHRNFGDQRPPALMEPRTLIRDGAPFTLPEERTVLIAADLDGDSRDELVYGTADGRVFAVHSGHGRLEVRNPHPLVGESSELWLGGHAVVAAGDLHGRGGLDLVAGDASGRLHLYTDSGGREGHAYRLPVVIDAGGAPFQVDPGPDGMLEGPAHPRLGYACPALGDWTGHGRLDLLVGGAGGEVLLLRNDGSATDPRFGHPVPLRCRGTPLLTPTRVRPALVDWEGNGNADLISLDLQGFLCVYPREGAVEVGPPIPLVDRLGRVLRLDGGFGRSGLCALWAGPWCGSGRPDLLVGLTRGNRHVVPAICGLDLGDSEAIPTVVLLENLGHGVVCPRPFMDSDGRPLTLGAQGCSPQGVGDGNPAGWTCLWVRTTGGFCC